MRPSLHGAENNCIATGCKPQRRADQLNTTSPIRALSKKRGQKVQER